METNIPDKPERVEREESHPFTALESSDLEGRSSSFFQVPGHENMVIRKSFVSSANYGGDWATMTAHEKAEQLRKKLLEFKKMIARIGIPMAKTDYVIGEDHERGDDRAIFGVTERLDGENLEEMKTINREVAEKMDDIYEKIIADCVETFLVNGYYWYDSNNAQFMYGKKEGDEKPDVYLVDMDPNIFKWDAWVDPADEKEYQGGDSSFFWNHMQKIGYEIDDLEKKSGVKLTKSREMFKWARNKISQ